MSDFMRWVTHGVKRGRFEMNSRVAITSLVFFVAMTLMAALYLMLVSQTAAQGRHIEQLQADLFRLQRENEQLEVESAREGAVSRLLERADALGFVPAQRLEFLTAPGGSQD